MQKTIDKLKNLGAEVEEVEGGLKLIGDWSEKYNKYHNLFVEITGELDTYHTTQHKDFLRNLNSLGGLYTSNATQHKDFLRNLALLGGLYTHNTTQHKDFLRNLASLVYLYTNNAIQHPEFLRNLKTLSELKSIPIQHPNFLKNFSDKKKTLETHINNYKLNLS